MDIHGCLEDLLTEYTYQYGPHGVISATNNSQIWCKMSASRHPLCTEIGMLCHKERHTLLLECFITFLRCMRMNGRASVSIYMPLMVHTVSFILKTPLNFHVRQCQRLGTPFLKGNGISCCKERHPLLIKCLITFLRYMRMIGRASHSIYRLVMVNTVLYYTKHNITLKFHAVNKMSAILLPYSEQ